MKWSLCDCCGFLGKSLINPQKPECQKKAPAMELKESLFKERKTTLNSKINIFLCLWVTLCLTSSLMRMPSPSLWFCGMSVIPKSLSLVWQWATSYSHKPDALLFFPQKPIDSPAPSFLKIHSLSLMPITMHQIFGPDIYHQ